MKLKPKIQIGLLTLFAIITLLAIVGGRSMQNNASNSKDALMQNRRNMILTNKITSSLSNLVLVVSQDSAQVVSAMAQMRTSMSEIKRSLKQQIKTIEDDSIAQVLSQDIDALNFEIISSNVKNIYDARTDLMSRIADIEYIVKAMMAVQAQGMSNKVREVNEVYTTVTIVIIITSFLLFVLAAVALFYIPEYIADPIMKISNSLEQIMDKNYNSRVYIDRQDEIGDLADSFNKMAEKLEEYEGMNVQNLLLEKHRLENIINRVKEAIIGLDSEHKVLFVNQAFLDLVKIPSSNIVGKSVDKLSQRYSRLKKLFDNLKNKNQATPGFQSIQFEEKDKSYYYERELIEVSLGIGNVITHNGYILLFKNITEFREHDLAKTNFMATLSHELKTPISAIDMSLSLLKDKRIGSLNEDQTSLTSTIKQNITRLLTLINEIMEVSKIETGNIIMVESKASPSDIVDQALSATGTFIDQKEIELEKVIVGDLPLINVDVQKTSGVLINFISNAVRYTPVKGIIRVEVSKHGNDIEFRVSDNGKGIIDEDLKNIFKRFKRAKNDITKGTGLGLAISKEFIEKQGGRIWANSKLAKGCTFGFALPLHKKA
ncbi:MAG: ATP-binding protein [Saprospiraceae bacterium]|nr:ATP-binding protein [Saprospiraceae bacterium]